MQYIKEVHNKIINYIFNNTKNIVNTEERELKPINNLKDFEEDIMKFGSKNHKKNYLLGVNEVEADLCKGEPEHYKDFDTAIRNIRVGDIYCCRLTYRENKKTFYIGRGFVNEYSIYNVISCRSKKNVFNGKDYKASYNIDLYDTKFSNVDLFVWTGLRGRLDHYEIDKKIADELKLKSQVVNICLKSVRIIFT